MSNPLRSTAVVKASPNVLSTNAAAPVAFRDWRPSPRLSGIHQLGSLPLPTAQPALYLSHKTVFGGCLFCCSTGVGGFVYPVGCLAVDVDTRIASRLSCGEERRE